MKVPPTFGWWISTSPTTGGYRGKLKFNTKTILCPHVHPTELEAQYCVKMKSVRLNKLVDRG